MIFVCNVIVGVNCSDVPEMEMSFPYMLCYENALKMSINLTSTLFDCAGGAV